MYTPNIRHCFAWFQQHNHAFLTPDRSRAQSTHAQQPLHLHLGTGVEGTGRFVSAIGAELLSGYHHIHWDTVTIHKKKVPGFNYHLRYFKEHHFSFWSDMDYEVCHGPMKDYCFSAAKRPATTQTAFYSTARADLTVLSSAIIDSYIRISPGIHFQRCSLTEQKSIFFILFYSCYSVWCHRSLK